MRPTLVLAAILLSSSGAVPASGHQDTVLSVRGDVIRGLPAGYQPARLNVEEGWLQVGAKRLDFPPCVAKYFDQQRPSKIQLLASWYHDPDRLPPYLRVEIRPRRRAYHFSLLFSLQDLRPIHFEVVIRESKYVTAYHRIAVAEQCLEAINRGISVVEVD